MKPGFLHLLLLPFFSFFLLQSCNNEAKSEQPPDNFPEPEISSTKCKCPFLRDGYDIYHYEEEFVKIDSNFWSIAKNFTLAAEYTIDPIKGNSEGFAKLDVILPEKISGNLKYDAYYKTRNKEKLNEIDLFLLLFCLEYDLYVDQNENCDLSKENIEELLSKLEEIGKYFVSKTIDQNPYPSSQTNKGSLSTASLKKVWSAFLKSQYLPPIPGNPSKVQSSNEEAIGITSEDIPVLDFDTIIDSVTTSSHKRNHIFWSPLVIDSFKNDLSDIANSVIPNEVKELGQEKYSFLVTIWFYKTGGFKTIELKDHNRIEQELLEKTTISALEKMNALNYPFRQEEVAFPTMDTVVSFMLTYKVDL